MEVKQTTTKTTGTQSTTQIKRTLNLTSLTVNAMALIAPGAFLWTTFQMQAAQVNGAVSTAGEMWTGLVATLVLAFLTAISYAELSDIYPKAGSGSSYYFAEAALLEKDKSSHRQYSRIAKFGIGWISPLLLDIPRYHGRLFSYFDCLYLRFVRRKAKYTGRNTGGRRICDY